MCETIWDHGGDPGGGPRENPRSLSSPKAEKFEFEKIRDIKLGTNRPTDIVTHISAGRG